MNQVHYQYRSFFDQGHLITTLYRYKLSAVVLQWCPKVIFFRWKGTCLYIVLHILLSVWSIQCVLRPSIHAPHVTWWISRWSSSSIGEIAEHCIWEKWVQKFLVTRETVFELNEWNSRCYCAVTVWSSVTSCSYCAPHEALFHYFPKGGPILWFLVCGNPVQHKLPSSHLRSLQEMCL